MEAPQTEPRRSTPIALRILFFSGGLIALGVGVLITLGAALAGAALTGIAAWRLRRRQKRLSRRGAWLATVGGTVGVLAILMGIGILAGQPSTPPTAAQRAEQRAKAAQAMPDWLKAINPGVQRQTVAADSIAVQLLENKAVMVWAGLMGAVISSAILGTIAGSFAWAGVMLMYRSFYDRWMPSSSEVSAGV